jgi:isocitrate dehydrogenase (NAD+)
VQLRKELDLYASLVHCFNLPGLKTRHDNVNIVVIRENTEGEYSGLEHEVVPGVVESLKVITKFCSERIAKYAFEYAYLNNRKTVTAVHKANIMKLADGLFLESCREVAKKYPVIKYNEVIVDNCCMQLVSKPQQFDVMVTPNLYGTLVANTAAGIAGGTGVMPGGNVGAEHAVFEQGASAGNVGNEKLVQGRTANPTALLLSSAMMLRHLQFPSFADRLEQAVLNVLAEGTYRTKDLGGTSSTQDIVDAVIGKLG